MIGRAYDEDGNNRASRWSWHTHPVGWVGPRATREPGERRRLAGMRRALLSALAAVLLLLPAAARAATPSWEPCPAGVMGARCGHVAVPLDRTNPAAGTLHVGFELYPRTRTDLPALGTLVDVEGGPGYATTASRSWYLQLDAPLLDRRNLLLVDA